MKYLELTIKAESNLVECLLNELSLAGIYDAAIDNPSEIAEMVAGLGDTEWYDAEQVQVSTSELASVTVYCTDDEEGNVRADSVRAIVAKLQGENCDITLAETVRDDSEWKDAWKEYYHTAQVSEKFVVKPTWEDAHVDDGLFVIEIDPGMAFGTGTHETTSLSLKLMEKHVKRGDRVLDVGTGSGILAIAAAKLGASDILGIDIDQDAVRVANENIANNIAPTSNDANVRAVVGDLTEGIDFTADVVVANLLADLVMKLTSSVAKHMADDAIYITSGILVEKQKQVAECLTENNFTIIEILEDGEWCAIAAVGNDD